MIDVLLLGTDSRGVQQEESAHSRRAQAERAQLEMQLVVARVAAAAAVMSEAPSRGALDAARQFAEDRATATQAAAATATTERESLETRLAQAKAEIEELRAVVVTTNDVAEKATTATTAAVAATQNAAHTAAQEKMALETKVAELEQELVTAESDLKTVNRQFSEVTNRLQVVSDEVTRLREDNFKLSQDVDGEAVDG
jgi:chromosome segregation ATPase